MVKATIDNRVIFIVLNTNESITVPSNEAWKVKINYNFISIGGANKLVPKNEKVFIPGGTVINNIDDNDKAFINGVVVKE